MIEDTLGMHEVVCLTKMSKLAFQSPGLHKYSITCACMWTHTIWDDTWTLHICIYGMMTSGQNATRLVSWQLRGFAFPFVVLGDERRTSCDKASSTTELHAQAPFHHPSFRFFVRQGLTMQLRLTLKRFILLPPISKFGPTDTCHPILGLSFILYKHKTEEINKQIITTQSPWRLR